MNEIWKVYKITRQATWEVSNYGNVKKNGKPYECGIYGFGYKRFAGGEFLHKIVAKLFIPNPDNKPQVDHIDTNKLNNHVDNLRWVTRKENQNNPLTLQHISEAMSGRTLSEEHKRKLGEATKKRYEDPGERRKTGEAQIGKHHTEETKQRLRDANTGEKNPAAKKCIYNGIEFGSKKDAWNYAVKYDGYDKTYTTFRRHYKG